MGTMNREQVNPMTKSLQQIVFEYQQDKDHRQSGRNIRKLGISENQRITAKIEAARKRLETR